MCNLRHCQFTPWRLFVPVMFNAINIFNMKIESNLIERRKERGQRERMGEWQREQVNEEGKRE